jgi:squalene-associated FAD-dependent desaturase
MDPSTVNAFDVAVIGAGFAGLSAAVRLCARGARVLVLEARSRLGGRATAFVDRETGEVVDNGQHVLLGCYTETLSFLERVGALPFVKQQSQLTVTMIDRAGVRSRLSCPALPAPLHLLAGVWDWEALDWSDRWSALRMVTPLRLARKQLRANRSMTDPGPIAASPGETVESWLIRNGQTARLREMLWEPLALAALNQPARQAAAPVFARVLAEMFGTDPRAASIVLPTKPLDQVYAEPARCFVEAHGGTVRVGAAGTIRLDDDAVIGVEAGSERWGVGAAISAVPWYALETLFAEPPEPLSTTFASARRMQASPIVTVNLWFDRPVLDEAFVGLPGRALQWAFEKRELFGPAASHVALVASGASPLVAEPNPRLIELAHAELVDAVPAAREAVLTNGSVVREPRATFSLAPGEPARPSVETNLRGLYLAGDWIDTGLPATIESAVRSGHRAADAIR